jgi:hypothetical protein
MATLLYRRTLIVAILLVSLTFVASVQSEDLKVIQMEQDVRDLQRTVQQQSQRIDNLERELAQARGKPYLAGRMNGNGRPLTSSDASTQWLTMANWDRVRNGASELDVIAVLGPPTAVRKSDDGTRQTLLYSLEITAGGFLSGQVVLDDHHVVEVQKPALK